MVWVECEYSMIRGSNKGSHEGCNKGSHEGSHKGSQKGSSKGSHEGSHKGAHDGSYQGSPITESPIASPTDSYLICVHSEVTHIALILHSYSKDSPCLSSVKECAQGSRFPLPAG